MFHYLGENSQCSNIVSILQLEPVSISHDAKACLYTTLVPMVVCDVVALELVLRETEVVFPRLESRQ